MTKLLPAHTRVDNADFSRTYRHVVVPQGTALDDILRPGFWAHHATRLNVDDIIDIVSEDRALDVQVRVRSIGPAMAEMAFRYGRADAPATVAKIEEEAAEAPEGYKVSFAPRHGWRVLMDGFAEPITKNHASKMEAVNSARAHYQKSNAVAA